MGGIREVGTWDGLDGTAAAAVVIRCLLRSRSRWRVSLCMGYSKAGNTLGGSHVDARSGREKERVSAPQDVTFAENILAAYRSSEVVRLHDWQSNIMDLSMHYALAL